MASALLGVSDVITIPAFPGLEQLFAKLRIAGKWQHNGIWQAIHDKLWG
jgi:hypothetical protein